MTEGPPRKRVVYLIGAGATHACAQARGSSRGILMRDLGQALNDRVRALVQDKYPEERTLNDLVNAVVYEDADFEQIITFLDESASALHRRFAEDLRKIFEEVLLERLESIKEELGKTPVDLYSALLDMHNLFGFPEELSGILTTNYDEYIEEAASEHRRPIDFGVRVQSESTTDSPLKLIKLHGSFGWQDVWPILQGPGNPPLWIPPGIQKAKERYPFNVLWGLARELLECDVLRIIGVRLGSNDWDLISLLFTTRHTTNSYNPYTIEVIDAPQRAAELQKAFPYLEVQSILEVEPTGSQIIAEFLGGSPRVYADLTQEEAINVSAERNENWFRLWLKHKAETLLIERGSVDTERGAFKILLEEY